MKTISGVLKFGKREEEQMRAVLQHVKWDMNFGGGGTFSKGDNENTFDVKEAEKVKKGIELFEAILLRYKQ